MLDHMTDAEAAQWRNQRIGFVFQSFHLLPRASLLENILLPMRYAPHLDPRAVEARSHQLARLLGLEGRLGAKPSELSVDSCSALPLHAP